MFFHPVQLLFHAAQIRDPILYLHLAPSGLPETPVGMQYQLWAIIDGKPVDAGMILSNSSGDKYHIQKMKSFGKAEAFAITLETQGGNATPTMDKMYVIAKVI